MKRFLVALLFVLLTAVPSHAAPFLAWDPVTTGADGLPLGAGLEVQEYHVYTCGVSVPGCATAPKVLVGTVLAPSTQFNLAGSQTPIVYVVRAKNIVGESADSVPFKVVPPDVPKNPRITP